MPTPYSFKRNFVMNGNKWFLDTNIILYLLAGDTTLADLLDGSRLYVSVITEMELLSYRELSENDRKIIRSFLSECKIIYINHEIKEETVRIRTKFGIKLPDSIIAASAIYLDLPLLTADRDFSKIEQLDLVLYSKD